MQDTSRETAKRTFIAVCNKCGMQIPTEIEDNEFTAMFKDGFKILCDQCYEKTRQEQIEKDRMNHRNDVLRRSQIPAEFIEWNKELGNRELAFEILNNNTKHLYVYGPNGTCKTRAMAYNLYRLANKDVPVQFWRFGELALKYAQCLKSDEDGEEFFRKILLSDILMLDDIGKRKPTPTAAELLYLLLDKVYSGEAHAKLWMTFNRSLNELFDYFDTEMADAIVSRIDRLADNGKLALICSTSKGD